MKKLLITLAALLVSVSAFAQGAINFNNRNLTGPNGSYNAPIGGDTVGGSAQLYLVGAGGALTPLTPLNTFRPSPNQSFFTGPVEVTVPGQPPGTANLTFRVRAWNGAASYDAASLRGESADFTVAAPLGGANPNPALPPITPPDTSGLQSFALVPEPSTIALGLLGAAALLLRRRK